MKSKLKILLLITFLSLSLSSCIKEYKLNEEETNIVAEYMAGMLLKYDKSYEGNLIPLEELEPIEMLEESSQEEDGSEKEKEKKLKEIIKDNNELLTEIINIENLNFEIKDCIIQNDFLLENNKDIPYFGMQAKNNHNLFIIIFNITNKGEEVETINLLNNNIRYILEVSDKRYKPLFTVIPENMYFLKANIKPNENKEAILFFEIEENSNIGEVKLKLINDEKSWELILDKEKAT